MRAMLLGSKINDRRLGKEPIPSQRYQSMDEILMARCLCAPNCGVPPRPLIGCGERATKAKSEIPTLPCPGQGLPRRGCVDRDIAVDCSPALRKLVRLPLGKPSRLRDP